MSAQPCLGCGAAIDCIQDDGYRYTLTADPALPFFFICPPGETCLPPTGQTSTLSINCCGHIISAVIQSYNTDAQISLLLEGLLAQCQLFSGECSDPPLQPPSGGPIIPKLGPRPPVPQAPNAKAVFLNSKQECEVKCRDGASTPFKASVPAGAFADSTQAKADAQAMKLACNKVAPKIICLDDLPTPICPGNLFFVQAGTTTLQGSVNYILVAGSVPTGLVFSNNYLDVLTYAIFGTPTTPGIYSFSIQATDNLGRSVTRIYNMTVFGITNTILPAGTVGTPYTAQLVIVGAKFINFLSTAQVAVNPADIPPGLSMTGDGLITGTPSLAGVFGFNVTVSDASGCSFTQTITVTINGPPAICPDWTQLLWQVPLVQGINGGTASFSPDSVVSDNFSAMVDSPAGGSVVFPIQGDAQNFATLDYNGPGCNCNLHLHVSNVSGLLPEADVTITFNLFVIGMASVMSAGPIPPDIFPLVDGDYDWPFTVPSTGGATQSFNIEVLVRSNPSGIACPTLEHLEITGTFSNLP
jgi:hypothetical protein